MWLKRFFCWLGLGLNLAVDLSLISIANWPTRHFITKQFLWSLIKASVDHNYHFENKIKNQFHEDAFPLELNLLSVFERVEYQFCGSVGAFRLMNWFHSWGRREKPTASQIGTSWVSPPIRIFPQSTFIRHQSTSICRLAHQETCMVKLGIWIWTVSPQPTKSIILHLNMYMSK